MNLVPLKTNMTLLSNRTLVEESSTLVHSLVPNKALQLEPQDCRGLDW